MRTKPLLLPDGPPPEGHRFLLLATDVRPFSPVFATSDVSAKAAADLLVGHLSTTGLRFALLVIPAGGTVTLAGEIRWSASDRHGKDACSTCRLRSPLWTGKL